MYDYLVVGAGLFGAVFAHEARRKGRSVLVIESREHIGGNCYTEDKQGVNVHVYGPHIFHTSDERIWRFVNQFTKFNGYVNRTKVSFRDRIFSFPINLFTLHQLWGVRTPAEAESALAARRIPCENPRNLEEWILSQVGNEIYETFIYGYTKKQWMREPSALPSSIIKRIPIRMTYDDNYFDDVYQGIPIDGYTPIFSALLDKCEVELGVDFFKDRLSLASLAKRVVYTGKVDQYFDFVHGELEYRTLEFKHEVFEGNHQGNAIINYTDESVPFTRVTEHKHFQPQRLATTPKTIVTQEFPRPWASAAVPFYPVVDSINTSLASKYHDLSTKERDVVFGGRLAEFKYYDMHQVIGSALHRARIELK